MQKLACGALVAPALVVITVLAHCGGGAADLTPPPPNYGDAGDTGVPSCGEGGCDAPYEADVCTGAHGSCIPAESVPPGKACTFTADCQAGYYCGDDGTCDPAGDGTVGATCTTSGSCVRGAVCYRTSPGLYGTCQLPVGVSIPVSIDGGNGTLLDGGSISGGSGTAQGIGGKCTTLLDCMAGLACSSMNTCQAGVPGAGLPTPWLGVTCNDALPEAGTGVRAYFEVPAADGTPPYDFFRLPFPSDVRRDPTTHLINLTGFPHPGTALLGFDIVQLYATQSEADLDGFGTNQYVYFRFSNAVNLDTLTVTGTTPTVNMYDLTAGAPTPSLSFSASTSGNRYICDNNVKITPGTMIPGHTYAVTLGSGITDTSGHPVEQDTDFVPMLGTSTPSSPTLAAAYAAFAPLRAYLTKNGIDPATIVDATVFTTQTATAEMPLLRQAVLATPAPTATGFVLCSPDGGVSPCDDGLTGAAHVRGCIPPFSTEFDELQGKISDPIMQQGTRPYSTVGEGAIQLGDGGVPVPNGSEDVCVSITVPHGVAPPAGGWPVVLYAHGTGGYYRSGILEGLAGAVTSVTLPPAGDAGKSDAGAATTAQFAFVGFDGVMTGPRAGMNVTANPDTLFFNFANPVAARDNVLQGSADIFQLVRALQTIKLAGLPGAGDTTSFDPKRIYFIGHSQGSTVGVPAAPYEPGLAGMVFSGAGGDLRVSLVTKTNPVDIADLTPYVLEDSPVDPSHPALNLFQAFIERSDAVNYGGYLLQNLQTGVTARPLVQTYGIGDTYAPDPTMQVVAGAIGLNAAGVVPPSDAGTWPPGTPLVLPVMNNFETASGNVTAALLEAAPTGPYDGHFVLFDDPALQQQVMQFLGTASRGAAIIE